MTILAILIFTIALVVAFAGVVLPVLPGVPIAALGAFIAAWLIGFQSFGLVTLCVIVALVVLAIVLDYAASALGAKGYGASTAGLIGGVAGSIAGLMMFPPLGFLIGAFAGAVVAELIVDRHIDEAVRSGIGALVGTLGGLVIKVAILIVMAVLVYPKLF